MTSSEFGVVLALSAGLTLAACKPATTTTGPAGHVRFLDAPAGDVAKLVVAQAAASKQAGRRLLVYVGATWCEPCQRFHRAAEAGALDAEFPTLDLLAFDADADNERLAFADCDGRLIPRLATTTSEGHCRPDARLEGSVKGEGAVGDLTPRIRALLDQ